MKTIYEYISGYGDGFHEPIRLAFGEDKSLNLFVHGEQVYSSEAKPCPGCIKRRAKKAAEMKRYRARRKNAGKRIKG